MHPYLKLNLIVKIVELEFDEIRVGLDRRTLIYLDVRRREELLEHGKVAATHSVNIPCM